MLAEIFMLRLEANARLAQYEPIPVSPRFVPFDRASRFELKKRSRKQALRAANYRGAMPAC